MFSYHPTPPSFPDIKSTDYCGMRLYQLPSGVWVPSVTTILGVKEKPWLDNWRTMLGASAAAKETARCAERGTAVHLMCERYLKNETIESIHEGQPREYIKLFNQIKLALNNKVSNIRAQEVPLWSEKYATAGRVDLIADYKGVPSIIDFKTSNNNKTEDMIEDYFLQCTAYALMYFYLYDEPIENIVVIITVEKGIMPLVFIKNIDDYVAPWLQRIKEFKAKKGKLVEEANVKFRNN